MSEVVRLYRYKSLLSSRRAVSAEDLMASLEVSRATLKRDIAKLRDQLHAPITFNRDLGGYRLQRIKDSLGLLVVDQDMGDEVRSVHSLSGGESFLVSLALALGLASLSSHRVRVESLFIDEGFGSLDADSLSIAMDALDNLQSQGRKVGVISHVQEMTERIGTRMQVQRHAGGLSRISVC